MTYIYTSKSTIPTWQRDEIFQLPALAFKERLASRGMGESSGRLTSLRQNSAIVSVGRSNFFWLVKHLTLW